jgi:predicted nucleic acid-binding Zn ribbon protein
MDAENNSKPKTVATIDVNLIPKMSSREWIAETVDEHLHCVLCGSELRFQHKTDFIEQIVAEEAHCPICNVRNRQQSYRLQ